MLPWGLSDLEFGVWSCKLAVAPVAAIALLPLPFMSMLLARIILRSLYGILSLSALAACEHFGPAVVLAPGPAFGAKVCAHVVVVCAMG